MEKKFLRTTLMRSILPFLCSLIFLCNSSEAADGKVVTIDGIAGLASLVNYVPPVPSSYLYNAIDSDWRTSFEEKLGQVQPFPWSGSAYDTSVVVENLYNSLKTISDQNKLTNAPLVIISHSWGTVLTYIVLRKHPEIIVDKLITMGSPLESIFPGVNTVTYPVLVSYGILTVDALPNVKIWHNYWATCDQVSASISAAMNHKSDLPGSFCHGGYFEDSVEWGNILNDAYDTLPPLAISYSPIFLTAPINVNFTAIGSLTNDVAASYSWDFGDSQNGTGPCVSHYYKNSGIYNVTLTLTDKNSETHVVHQNAYVSPPPINVTFPNGFEDLYRHFETPANAAYKAFAWDFGDGVVRTDDNNTTSHTYSTSGYFNVRLTITLQDDSTITSEQGIFVGPGTRIIQGHTIYGDETWYSGGTYEVQGNISVAQGATLTIEPDVTVKLNSGVQFNINGTLHAVGTSTSKIMFTWADGQNSWGGVVFSGGAANSSQLEGCEFEHASSRGYVLNITGSSPTITGNTITGSNNSTGINIIGNTSIPQISGNNIRNCGNAINSDNIVSISGVGNNVVTGNQLNGIYFYCDLYSDKGKLTVNATWNSSLVYAADGYMYIPPGITLAIEPGTIVKFGSFSLLNVGGTLIANGTADKKIVFTHITDDTYGGDTNGDGNATHPGVYQDLNGNTQYNVWAQMSLGPNSVINNAVIKYGGRYGYNTYPALSLGDSVTVSNSEIINNDSDGIAVSGASIIKDNTIAGNGGSGIKISGSPTITGNTITGTNNPTNGIKLDGSPLINANKINGYTYGIYCEGATSIPIIQNNIISGNTTYGLANIAYYRCPDILATNNNWGDPSGPLDESDDRASGGWYNPNGEGNKVSDNVNYYPWTGCTIPLPAAPISLAGIPSMSSVNLKWTPPAGSGISAYKVYYGTSTGIYGAPQVVGNVSRYKLANLNNGTPYFISVSAMNSIGAEGDKSPEISETPVNKYPLTLSFTGDGHGTVVSDPGGIAGNVETYALFDPNAPVTLKRTVAEFSLFDSWTEDCTGKGDCTVTMDNDRYVTAGFNEDREHKTLIFGTSNFNPTLITAYAASSTGNIIQAWGTDFIENIQLNLGKAITLKGGFNQGYTANGGYTTLHGTLTVGTGSLTVERLVIR